MGSSPAMRVAVVGHMEWCEFAEVPHMPEAGEIVHATATFQEPGGGGSVAAVQLRKLAGSATLFPAFGDDEAVRRARRARVLVATPRGLGTLADAHVELDALVLSGRDPGEAYRQGDLDP